MKKSFKAMGWLLALALVCLQGCDNNEVDPKLKDVVKVAPATEIGTFSATVSVTISTKGIFTVIEKGICWDLNSKPDINDKKLVSTSTTGEFKFTLSLPEDNKDYYVRPYFKDDFGNIIYGNEITFKTLKDLELSIVSKNATEITELTATIATSISATGTGTIASRGICWGLQENPVIGTSASQAAGSGPGDFTVELKQLSPNRKYFARAYGTSNTGKTTYGNQVTFSTLPVQPFTVTVVTKEAGASSTTATTGGIITGTGNVAERGVCINKTGNPTIYESRTSDGKGIGEFTSSLTGLTQGTIYYVRAFATSNMGQTVYGNQVMFVTTLGGSAITFSTKPVTSITNTTAVSGGDLQGTGIVAMKGICWNTSPMPTVANNKTENGPGFGSYSATITGLTTSTKYYVRAYAITSAGTIYGNEVSFNTPDVLTVTTTPVSSISPPGAVGGGSVSGTGTVTARGICWNTSPAPTIENNVKTTDGSGLGSFTSTLTGLTYSRTYYVRAYAVSAGGVTYGNQLTFTTPAFVATSLTTATVTGITKTSAVSGGTVTGSAAIAARGVCWSTAAHTATIAGNKTTDGSGSGTFSSTITGLASGTMYYVRAYATDNGGTTTYGPVVSFATQPDFTVTTSAATNITATSATSGGTITGTASLQSRGICWSTSQNPTTSNSVANGSGPILNYTGQLTGLLGSTTYYVRAYAITTGGVTVYGNEISFTTSAAAVVTTTEPTAITFNSALTGGTITSTQSITQRGVTWGTAPNPVRGVQQSVNSGSGTGTFTLNVTGLSANVTYYVRAYAVTSAGQTVYGDQKIFKTLN
jgi:hypothetical protein